ncbi:hypothetical protein [Stagnihabitans tardus]|uniref:Uncharacterized protein n=1 Tax=Stagnihabitans tardus TaxID=2699202 RepID=A0AAE4YA79_9RHOB|nr:hypothetical protein [Stagnihabitans tardus]NBZ88918.1 hypothetical protein [Stagnihabitans tardus]
MQPVLMLGSAPSATEAAAWPKAQFGQIVVINNAWRIRPDWDQAIYPWDFPPDRHPTPGPGQKVVAEEAFVAAQNRFGGFVYGGGTMAFTTAYWILDALRPPVVAAFGCDMHYPTQGPTHFYGQGTPDPLRDDISLRSLEAKSARFLCLAAREGVAAVNLSQAPSRLIWPRVRQEELGQVRPLDLDPALIDRALAREAELDYVVPSGRYWEERHRFDPALLDEVDSLWLQAARSAAQISA